MKHLPLDPFSIIALACMAAYFVAAHLRRRWQRAHWSRLSRSIADVASNGRGAR